MCFSAASTTPAVDKGDRASIYAVHPDIITAHILTCLDGQTLAAVACASSELRAFSAEEKLWRDISTAMWPSTTDPRVNDLISTFPAGHRSFFSDSFPLLDHSPSQFALSPSSPTAELISAVDIFYKGQLIFSKVQASETESEWFLCSPFRVDLLDPKETFRTPIRHAGEGQKSLKHLEENLSLSWIVIDPTRKRAANLSSRRPVTVQKHRLTGEIHLRFATILVGEKKGEYVQCGAVVTCKGTEGGELHVREVSMHVEAMEGNHLNGRESLVILQTSIEGGKRRKEIKGKARLEEYLEMKRERKKRRERREKALDMICIATGVTIFMAFWSFILFR
ncbi:F-box protein At2g27310-like [Pyrus communis]|uniref:F-box protein At2g27310-like n=1 Tax=Pyrus communis TaxID=23211 RepID=UPI0035BFEE04